jgi:N-acyl-D-amino-acid deacylase
VPDLLVRGGDVVDGTGAPARRTDVLLRDGRIFAMAAGGVAPPPGVRIVDATGRLVLPGFVDIHTHSDLTLLSSPAAPSAVHQGVTTVVVGNCGLGTVPVPEDPAEQALLRAAVAYLDLDPAVAWTWRDLPGYRAALDRARPSANVGVLAAHLPLHTAVLGYADRAPDAAELATLRRLLHDQLDAGALGLSTGLAYAPLTTVQEPELVALAEVVAAHDALFAWHVRDYGDALLESVAQVLRVARASDARVQISHLVGVGRRNWGRVRAALDLVDAALADGVDVGVDVYPYLAGNCPLSQLLPAWAQPVGTAPLHDRGVRQRIRDAWSGQPVGWDEITVSRAPDAGLSGTTIGALGGADAALDLLAVHGNDVMITAGGRSPDDLRDVLTHPAAVVASDGQAIDPTGATGVGVPHPRSFGCFPRFLRDHTGPDRLPFADAVRRCTSAPAARIGRRDLGRVAAGGRADLVVVDPERLRDVATYADPQRHPEGVVAVIVGGAVVLDDARHTGAGPGTVLGPRME